MGARGIYEVSCRPCRSNAYVRLMMPCATVVSNNLPNTSQRSSQSQDSTNLKPTANVPSYSLCSYSAQASSTLLASSSALPKGFLTSSPGPLIRHTSSLFGFPLTLSTFSLKCSCTAIAFRSAVVELSDMQKRQSAQCSEHERSCPYR